MNRELGVFETVTGTPGISSTSQDLAFEERTAIATVNQLLGDYWSAGIAYRLSRADLASRFVEIPSSVNSAAVGDQEATLHQTRFVLALNTPCGFFAQTDASWIRQSASAATMKISGSTTFISATGCRGAKQRCDWVS